MGRTLPSITQAFLEEQQAFSRFRRALRRSDQQALDDLFASAQQHLAAAAYAAHALPLETFLIAMLLEEHKEVMRLRILVELLLTRQTARSYFSYEQTIFRGEQVHLFGRWHIDRSNVMTWRLRFIKPTSRIKKISHPELLFGVRYSIL